MNNNDLLLVCPGSQSESDSLASEEGANDDNTDDELSKVVGGLEFAIDRQESDSKKEQKKEITAESKPQSEKKADAQEDETKPLHSLQSVRILFLLFAFQCCSLMGMELLYLEAGVFFFY